MRDMWLWIFVRATDPDVLPLLFIAMAPGLGLDPFQQIVNVQWTSGLAVEFYEGNNGGTEEGI
jgi:hypothetical protein